MDITSTRKLTVDVENLLISMNSTLNDGRKASEEKKQSKERLTDDRHQNDDRQLPDRIKIPDSFEEKKMDFERRHFN